MDRWERHYSVTGGVPYAGGADSFAPFWGRIVTNYLAPPNFINTVLPHLGRMFRIRMAGQGRGG